MVTVFHGSDAETHDAFQAWRQAHPNGFHMTEKGEGIFVIHWTQDKRENASGRGCHHQGVSSIRYLEDKDSCYTATRKVCSDCLAELIGWTAARSATSRSCAHCDTAKFPFPKSSA